MRDEEKTKEQLIDKLAEARQQVAELEASVTKIKQERDLLSLVIETASEGITLSKGTEEFFIYNPAMKDITGYSQKEAQGTDFPAILYPNPDYRAKAFAAIKEAIEVNDATNQEWEVTRKDGSKRTVLISTRVLNDYNQESWLLGMVRDITELKQVEEALKASLEEKEVLLKEIHHRVKNNLQVISSLINLQLRNITGEKDSQTLKEIQNRIQSIAIIHEKLHQSEDMARIDFSEYIQSLTAYLYQTYMVVSAAITLKVNVDDIFFNIDTAVPCGLIINELVSNALKHAFTEGVKGEIRIDCHSDTDNQLTLTVSDNGVGFPQDLDFQNTKSLGLRLVVMLTEQLDGTIKLDRSDGTKFEIAFWRIREVRKRQECCA